MKDPATKIETQRRRFTNVDAMRGLAATLVVWIHVSEIWAKSHAHLSTDLLYRTADYFGVGRIGVLLFFCISGFVIPSSLYGSRGEGLCRFAVRRFFRLYPAYWLSIPLGLVTSWYFCSRPITPTLVLGNLTMIPQWLHIEMIMGHYWTLHLELFFYLTCGAMFALNLLKSEAALLSTGLILHVGFVIGLGSHYLTKYTGLHFLNDFPLSLMFYTSNLGIMFWGTLLRLRFDGKILSKAGNGWLWLVPLFWAVGLPIMGLFGRYVLHNPNVEIIRFPLTAGVAILLFLCGLKLPGTTNRFALYLGAISYSLYLFHPVVHALVWKTISICFGNVEVSMGIVLLVSYSTAVFFATLIYQWVELPSQRLAKRLAQ